MCLVGLVDQVGLECMVCLVTGEPGVPGLWCARCLVTGVTGAWCMVWLVGLVCLVTGVPGVVCLECLVGNTEAGIRRRSSSTRSPIENSSQYVCFSQENIDVCF